MSAPLRIAVLASGQGSNLRAIVDAIDAGSCEAEVIGVVSDRAKAGALAFATERGIPVYLVPLRKGDDRDAWNAELARQVDSLEPQLVVLAGFMRVLDTPILERFPGRIINVHPALLPAFPGHDATAQAIAAKVRVSGCSVHVVDAGVDTGPVIAQAAVPVLPDDTPETLHARIQVQEHALLPKVIDWIAKGNVLLNPVRLQEPIAEEADTLVSPRFES